MKAPILPIEEGTAGRARRGRHSACPLIQPPMFSPHSPAGPATEPGTGLSWIQWGTAGVSRANYFSLYLLPYLPLWEYLGSDFSQWENTKPKRLVGLLGQNVLILSQGPLSSVPRITPFLRVNLHLQLH